MSGVGVGVPIPSMTPLCPRDEAPRVARARAGMKSQEPRGNDGADADESVDARADIVEQAGSSTTRGAHLFRTDVCSFPSCRRSEAAPNKRESPPKGAHGGAS